MCKKNRQPVKYLDHQICFFTRTVFILGVCTLGFISTASAQEQVADTVHNLSAGGPGQMRAVTESRVCIFCHATHSTAGVTPLWNRELSVTSYQIYQSSTMDASPNQPIGASKLCLSCHDGTIALGSVLSQQDRILMLGGDFIPAGLANLGSDLSDDHPISFVFSSGISASDSQLVNPNSLQGDIRLDAQGRMQCTSCHDAHRNRHGKFLVRDDINGALCMGCHVRDGWSASSHESSNSSVSGSALGNWPYTTVAANACRSCHRSHSAGSTERLLIHDVEEDNCLSCHDGSVAGKNIRNELDKPFAHDPRLYLGLHDPVETTVSASPHVECVDCHNPHAVRPISQGSSSTIGMTMMYVAGVTAGGTPTDAAQNEYEVCFRCHGDAAITVNRRVDRLVQQTNLRLAFSPTNSSFHPVVSSSPSTDTVSLAPGWTSGDIIRCTDCHNNDSGPRGGGAGPDGPHGSIYESLLERNYTTRDDTNESQFEYSLCYKCHQQSSILSDQSFPLHRKHIRNERTPCSACHDPHGISTSFASGSDHTHLINFDVRIVRPDDTTQRIQFTDLGRFAGSCTLTCHGEEHNDFQYGN